MQAQLASAEASTMTTLARQNDAFRQALMPIRFDGQLLRGRVGMTIGVANLDHEIVLGVLKKLREYSSTSLFFVMQQVNRCSTTENN